jgi:hypothetical protein
MFFSLGTFFKTSSLSVQRPFPNCQQDDREILPPQIPFRRGEELFGLEGLEVNHHRFPAQAASLAKQGSVNEDCFRRPQGPASSVHLTEHGEPRPD